MHLSASWSLLLHALVSIAVLVMMITWLRVHPFIALILSSALLGLSCGMPPSTVVHNFEKGFGDILGFAGITIALGAMLGQLLVTSGGAQNLAQTLVRLFGPRRVPWAMATTAMLVGLPLFFEIGFVLLLPLATSVARRLQEGPIRLALALLAGLSAVHCLVPPHPGPLLAIHIYGADTGKTLLYGLIAALPAVILAGIVYGGFIARRLDGQSGAVALAVPVSEEAIKRPAGAGITLATLLLPVALMLLGMLAPRLGDSNPWHGWLAGLGEPVVALLTALLAALMTLGMARGLSMGYIREVLDGSLAPIAAVLLLIGAGGGLKQMLVDSGVGAAMGRLAMQLPWSPLVLAYMVAALIRLATGSATVATITGAGLMAPVAAMPGSHRELLVLATGAGSLIFSHVNDAGFWMVKGFLGLSLRETLLTWTAIQTILSLAAMTMVLVLAQVIA